MFSSLASFLFGSNTNCETNSESTTTDTATGLNEHRETKANLLDNENLIQVTSLTPSVTGAGEKAQGAIKGGKNKRNKGRQQNKRRGTNKAPLSPSTKQVKVLQPINGCDEEDLNEDEWFIVEKEKEEELEVSDKPNDSEEENIPVKEVIAKTSNLENPEAGNNLPQQRRLQHINLHSLYSGPRPQKQRNLLQKTRYTQNNRPSKGLSVSTLSPSRTVNDGCFGSKNEALAEVGMTRSLYVASNTALQNEKEEAMATEGIIKMEESWFITPPPCFTSEAPIIMETSPYENLLIEHPSMSVYHSIKMAEEATDSFIKLDIGVKDSVEKQPTVKESSSKKNTKAVQIRNTASVYRLDRQSVAQLKQELLARNVQKVQIKHQRQDMCRSALKRSNKVRDVQSRNHIQRRSDRQQSKYCSNANNNRKTNCY